MGEPSFYQRHAPLIFQKANNWDFNALGHSRMVMPQHNKNAIKEEKTASKDFNIKNPIIRTYLQRLI